MAKRARVRTKRAAKAKTAGITTAADETSFQTMAGDPNRKVAAPPYDETPHNDELEGVIRDPVMFNGQVVSLIKDIGVHDAEYDPNVRQVKIQALGQKPQVVRAQDINTKNVVPRPEIERAPMRVSHLTFPKGHPSTLPGEGR